MAENAAGHLLSVVSKSPLAVVGAAALAYYSLKVLLTILRSVRAFFLPPAVDFRNHGQWAVVTGATDGIGKAYAEQLAEKGMDIVLISRSEQKLRDVAAGIETAYKVSTKIIVADFSKGVEIYPEIGRHLSGLDIGVLVNNVGSSYDHPEFFHLVANREEKFAAMINCNMLSVTEMTGLVLPNMVSKKKGIIINISSLSGALNVPFLSVYSATKSYVSTFTRALQLEYGSQGILIQLIEPMFVVSKLSKVKRASLFVPTATAYVRAALGCVGVLRDTTGCFTHWLQSSLLWLLPVWLRNAGMARTMLKTRNSAIRKAGNAAKKD